MKIREFAVPALTFAAVGGAGYYLFAKLGKQSHAAGPAVEHEYQEQYNPDPWDDSYASGPKAGQITNPALASRLSAYLGDDGAASGVNLGGVAIFAAGAALIWYGWLKDYVHGRG